jgi:hypothetical protein
VRSTLRLVSGTGGVDRDTVSMRDGSDIIVDEQTAGVDWRKAKAALAEDQFDNGRSADALRRSFENSDHVAFAWLDGDLVGMARMLSDGVCNAYLLDVWTKSSLGFEEQPSFLGIIAGRWLDNHANR